MPTSEEQSNDPGRRIFHAIDLFAVDSDFHCLLALAKDSCNQNSHIALSRVLIVGC